ncbi:MAG TPA: TetR/AcrR family transcriptional regulator [Planctomycetaceae bacterium]|nr:TetR/AcrR family transcriptional regulator [Planctomycetaceae bacterium]
MNAKLDTTKEKLLEAAIGLLAANPAASLADIASEAGVKRVTLHRLVGTRDDLLAEIASRSLAETDAACERAMRNAKTSFEALKACVEALVPVGDRWHFLWMQSEVWEEPSVAKKIARQNAELSELIEDAKAEGAIDAGIPTAWIVAAIEAVVFAALSTTRSGDIAVNDAGKLAVRTLIQGIEKKPVRKRARKK